MCSLQQRLRDAEAHPIHPPAGRWHRGMSHSVTVGTLVGNVPLTPSQAPEGWDVLTCDPQRCRSRDGNIPQLPENPGLG